MMLYKGRSGRLDGSTDAFQPHDSPGSFLQGPSPLEFVHRPADSEPAAQRILATPSLSSPQLWGRKLHALMYEIQGYLQICVD